MDRKVFITEDLDGNKTVFIYDIKFKGRKLIEWNEVERYLKRYVGEFYTVEASNDIVYIRKDLPDEYANSNYTRILKGTNAKAKANAAQGIPELLKIASNRQFEENRKEKHEKDAKFGWYSYDSRFELLVRHDQDGRKYLYYIMKIKKETSTLFQY